MLHTIKEQVTVQEGGRIEIVLPEISEGTQAEVTVRIDHHKVEQKPLASFIGTGKGCFVSGSEIDTFLRVERDSWES